MRTCGVLLMAHGAANSLEEIPAYLQDILKRPVPPPLVKDITERYRRIGGRSPLLEITSAQAEALQSALSAWGERNGTRFSVHVGMRHSEPTIRSAVEAAAGCEVLVAVPLTPYRSRISVGAYMQRLEQAAKEAGVSFKILSVGDWHEDPDLVRAFARKVSEARAKVPEALRAKTVVIFSAHSLPERVLSEGDPYPGQFAATVEAVAYEAGLKEWRLAYQSKGGSGNEPWLGPDVAEILKDAAAQGAKAAVVAPIGFISDHLETLYDDDIQYREQAAGLGLHFERAESLNADPGLIAALAAAVAGALP